MNLGVVDLSFLAHLAEGHVSYCHHLASVVVVDKNFSKLFFSDTTWSIGTKLGMNVPWGILQRADVESFDLLKIVAVITKNRGETVVFRLLYPQNL